MEQGTFKGVTSKNREMLAPAADDLVRRFGARAAGETAALPHRNALNCHFLFAAPALSCSASRCSLGPAVRTPARHLTGASRLAWADRPNVAGSALPPLSGGCPRHIHDGGGGSGFM